MYLYQKPLLGIKVTLHPYKKMAIFMDVTLVPSMVTISLPQLNKIQKVSKSIALVLK